MSNVKIFTIADVPVEIADEWLQHLRDFDTAHPGCHFKVVGDAPDMSVTEMINALMKIEPPLPVRAVYERELLNMEQMRKTLREFGFDVGSTDTTDPQPKNKNRN